MNRQIKQILKNIPNTINTPGFPQWLALFLAQPSAQAIPSLDKIKNLIEHLYIANKAKQMSSRTPFSEIRQQTANQLFNQLIDSYQEAIDELEADEQIGTSTSKNFYITLIKLRIVTGQFQSSASEWPIITKIITHHDTLLNTQSPYYPTVCKTLTDQTNDPALTYRKILAIRSSWHRFLVKLNLPYDYLNNSQEAALVMMLLWLLVNPNALSILSSLLELTLDIKLWTETRYQVGLEYYFPLIATPSVTLIKAIFMNTAGRWLTPTKLHPWVNKMLSLDLMTTSLALVLALVEMPILTLAIMPIVSAFLLYHTLKSLNHSFKVLLSGLQHEHVDERPPALVERYMLTKKEYDALPAGSIPQHLLNFMIRTSSVLSLSTVLWRGFDVINHVQQSFLENQEKQLHFTRIENGTVISICGPNLFSQPTSWLSALKDKKMIGYGLETRHIKTTENGLIPANQTLPEPQLSYLLYGSSRLFKPLNESTLSAVSYQLNRQNNGTVCAMDYTDHLPLTMQLGYTLSVSAYHFERYLCFVSGWKMIFHALQTQHMLKNVNHTNKDHHFSADEKPILNPR